MEDLANSAVTFIYKKILQKVTGFLVMADRILLLKKKAKNKGNLRHHLLSHSQNVGWDWTKDG